jgi:ABC-type nitrate/sulfonate/bicarbonate transport system ATPase subunit
MQMEGEGKMNNVETKKDDPVIKCADVGKTFVMGNRTIEVVRDLSLEVRKNEFLVLFGPGQCGKTTILNLIAGLEPVSRGVIMVDGALVDGPSPKRGMVYQNTALFEWFSVMKNVEFGPKVRGVPKKERRKLAQYYIDLVGLTGFENNFPCTLSGGMQQRVGIARAYCNNPTIICMDEPFGHLDAQTRYLMEEEIERVYTKDKRTVIFVTNNVEEAVYLADRIILLTNCPTHVNKEYIVDFPRPRSYVDRAFLELRQRITDDMDDTV